jgi:hypothetical protein
MTNKQYWSATEGVFNCLIDRQRTEAFASAIRKTVRPGDIVVDMGTGSGVLAMLAVRAGARLVYAVENDPRNISTLEQTLAANGFTDRVVVIQGDVTTVDLPGPVDVIIGEMVATALIEEAQIPAMNNMHRFAKPGARVLLRSMELYADLVSRPDTFYGLRFPVVGYEYPDEPTLQCTPFTAAHQYRVVDFSRPIQDTTIAADFALVISPPPSRRTARVKMLAGVLRSMGSGLVALLSSGAASASEPRSRTVTRYSFHWNRAWSRSANGIRSPFDTGCVRDSDRSATTWRAHRVDGRCSTFRPTGGV